MALKRRGLVILFSVLGVVLFLMAAASLAVYAMVGRSASVPANARLTLQIGGALAEMAPSDVISYVSGTRASTVRGIVDNLRKASVDKRIRSVLLKPTGFDTPYWGKIQEIRDAVLEFKKSGKPVYAYLEYGTDRDYYLATAADKVFLMPASPLDLTGVATYELFLRGTLDKVGVFPDLHHIGEYKTAANTFTEKTFTAAHREMDASLNRDLYEQIVRVIADGRKKTEADVRRLIDDGPFMPEDALRAGLIDDVVYEDQVVDKLKANDAPDEGEVDAETYGRVSLRSLGLNRGPRVAVIYASGTIVGGRSGYDPLEGAVVGSETLIEYIRKARKDASVRAIVLRVDSPGGSAAASDAIWRELMLARNERADRPIVVSMSDLAASGGYYIAMPAHIIVAEPSTLTGSIGIFGGKFVTGGIYEKLGAHIESTSIGRNAELNSPARRYNTTELEKVQEQLQAFYDQFVEKVATARHSTPEKIDQLAQGRVWTGRQAHDNGLVDALGGLMSAIDLAKKRAKIPADSDVELSVYPATKSFFELLAEQLSGSQEVAIAQWVRANVSRSDVDTLRALRGPSGLFRRGEALALMPFTFVR